jgi:glutaminyl-tRNA synthetase
MYERLFSVPEPDAGSGDFLQHLNPDSLQIVEACVEPSLAEATLNERYQFERVGYFYLDKGSAPGAPVFNRTISLKDSWSKGTAKP